MSLREKSASLSPNIPSNRRPSFEAVMSNNSLHPEASSNGATTNGNIDRLQSALDQIRDALRGLKYGSLTIQVQDGVVVQIDRTEKRRLQRPASSSENER